MGHLVDAIKKLEQQRVADQAKPARRPRAKTAKAKIQRIDKPHSVAGPARPARRRGSKPQPHVELAPAEDQVEPLDAAPPAEVVTAEVPAMVEQTSVSLPTESEPQQNASDIIAEALAILGAGRAPLVDLPPPMPKPASKPVAVESEPEFVAAEIESAPAELKPAPVVVEDESAPVVTAVPAPRIWEMPPAVTAGNYRELANYLCHSPIGARQHRALLLTAVSAAGLDALSVPGLAVALAAHGNLLWIDTRRQQPMSAAVDPTDAKNLGWHDLAAGRAQWGDVIRPTSLGQVSFVGGGHCEPADPSLQQPTPCLTGLPAEFSLVLVDGGLARESAALVTVCQTVGLAIAVGHDRRREVETALATLSAAGAAAPVLIALA